MEESSVFDLEKALEKLKRTCKTLKLCFLIATAVLSVFWIAVVAMLLLNWLGGSANKADSVLYAVVFGAFVVLISWNLTEWEEETSHVQKLKRIVCNRLQLLLWRL